MVSVSLDELAVIALGILLLVTTGMLQAAGDDLWEELKKKLKDWWRQKR